MTAGVTQDLLARFREAMASFPSGVTIVTTTAEDGTPWGFTATAFCSVSADPPLVLVCLARTAQCHPAFERARSWAIHVIHPGHTELATRFATRGADKFGGGEFVTNPSGLPVLPGVPVLLECSEYARYDGGDHTILVGRVRDVELGAEPPALYFRRGFHSDWHERKAGR